MTGSGRRPLIAIPGRFSQNATALRYEAVVLARAICDAVYRAGGEPVMVHPWAPGGEITDDGVAARLAFADGVLLPGGGDLMPHWYGQEGHPSLYGMDIEQDAFDLAVARVALAQRIPLLSICRGTQVVNVALGGTLVQDMASLPDDRVNHREHVHTVTVDKNLSPATLLDSSQPDGTLEVSCYHHQCIDTLGAGLQVCARAEDGTVEAICLEGDGGWFVGVQWHPEDMADRDHHAALFAAHVAAAATRGAGTAGDQPMVHSTTR